MLSLLAGCAGGTEVSPAPGVSGEPGTENTPDDAAASDEPAVSSAPSFDPNGNYLADGKFDTDEYLPDYDFVGEFVGDANVVEAESAYYFCSDSGYVIFADKNTLTSGPLCGKLTCTHSDDSCDAYGPDSGSLSLYDGKLYFMSGNTLMRMAPDGSAHEKVVNLGSLYSSAGTSVINMRTMLHRGYIYRSGVGNIVNEGTSSIGLRITAQAADSGERLVVLDLLYPLSEVDYIEYETQFVGNHLYIMVTKMVPDQDFKTDIYDWNSKNRQLTQLVSDNSGKELHVAGFEAVKDDGIYVTGWYRTSGGGTQNAIYRYDFSSGAFEKYKDVAENVSYSVSRLRSAVKEDDNGGYRRDVMKILDLNGEVVFDGSLVPAELEGYAVQNSVPVCAGSEDAVFMLQVGPRWTRAYVRVTFGGEPTATLLWLEADVEQ